MKKERFAGSSNFIILMSLGFIGMILAAHSDGRIPDNRNTLYLLLIISGCIALAVWSKLNTYIEIQDCKRLVNNGYRDWGKDTIDIQNIKYVYRGPQFIVNWFGGSLMVMYFADENGALKRTVLREQNYSDNTLKAFLLRLKELKPEIELDSEYIAFLDGKIELSKSFSANTAQSIENHLQSKGEKF